MTSSPEILELWNQHSTAALPEGYDGKKLNGIDLSLLDAEMASCIHRYVNQGTLEFRHLETLSTRLIDLNAIMLLLNTEEMAYFNRLRTLAALVLQEVKARLRKHYLYSVFPCLAWWRGLSFCQ